ncbi:MAG: N-acetylmuramoyl-L-alanine amidase [Clostridia bacterium]|nr:N-acetylmuramoyl-L-alanine amidase [Clostridia bacterium]
MPSVYLSPSIQQANLGVGDYGNEEYRMNIIADFMVPRLQAHGLTVFRNRPSMTLAQVIADSNQKRADIHLAIHSNAASSPQAQGTEVWYFPGSARGKKLADALYREIAPLSPGRDRGIKGSSSLAELRKTRAPAAIVELGFHTNPEDAKWIMEQPQAIAEALVRGLVSYFGLPYLAPSASHPQPPQTPEPSPELGPSPQPSQPEPSQPVGGPISANSRGSLSINYIVLPLNGPMPNQPGGLWYGDGYEGEGLYVHFRDGWHKIKT